MNVEHFDYAEEGDGLAVYFSEAEFTQRRPVWTIELTPHMMIRLDRTARQAVQLTLLDYALLVRTTDGGPIRFPLTGLADLPKTERQLVLVCLTAAPVNRWLDISTVTTRRPSKWGT